MNRKTITLFRKTHRLKQVELAELMGTNKSNVSSYERGHLRIPSWFKHKMERLIDEYGIDWDLELDPGRITRIEGERAPRTKISEPVTASEEVAATVIELPPASNHYNAGQLDHIDVIKYSEANYEESELVGFYRISALKYVARYGKKKGYNKEDLQKAIFFIKKLEEVTS